MQKSIKIILMMKNTVNSTVKYIMLQFKIAVFFFFFFFLHYDNIEHDKQYKKTTRKNK